MLGSGVLSWSRKQRKAVWSNVKHKETQNPGRELICVEVGDLNELASSWKELYMFSPLPIIKGIIANPNFKLKCRKNVIFPREQ